MPVMGARFSVIAMFSTTCTNQLANSPNATRLLKESFDRSAILVTRRNSDPNSAIASVTPRNPSSSPTTAKMKSVC